MKSILFPHLSFLHHGGTKIYLEIANELAKNNHVEIMAPKGNIKTPYEISEKIIKHEINFLLMNKFIVYIFYLIYLPYKIRHYDVVIITSPVVYYSVLLAKLFFGVNFYYIVQDIEYKYKLPSPRIIFNFPIFLTYFSKRIISANTYLSDVLIDKFKNKPLFTFNVWLSDEFFTQRENDFKKVHDIAYLPRREYWKGLHSFLEVMKTINKKLKILLISQDEKLMSEIIYLLQDSAHEISMVKPDSVKKVINCYSSCRLLFFTSTHEGFALPPLEAMSCGVPPVLYPSGGPSVYAIDNYNCKYFRKISEVGDIFEELLKLDEGFEKIASNGITTSENFKKSKELPKIVKYLEKEMDCKG